MFIFSGDNKGRIYKREIGHMQHHIINKIPQNLNEKSESKYTIFQEDHPITVLTISPDMN